MEQTRPPPPLPPRMHLHQAGTSAAAPSPSRCPPAVSGGAGAPRPPHVPPPLPPRPRARERSASLTTTTTSTTTEATSSDVSGPRTATGEALRRRRGPMVELKLVLFGQVGCGKTRLADRFVCVGKHDRRHQEDGSGSVTAVDEEEEVQPTVGASYLVKLISLHGTRVKCSLWDVSGAEHFVDRLGHMFYQGAHAVLFVFDVTDIKSFIYVKKLIEEVTTSQKSSSAAILVGTKCDKQSQRQVQESEVRLWAGSKQINYHETSALWPDEKVQTMLYAVAEVGLQRLLDSPAPSNSATQATSLPEWVPDSSGNSCTTCGTDFHLVLRRHHCRRCGFIFCGRCSTQKIALPAFGLPRPVRVCDSCYHSELKSNH